MNILEERNGCLVLQILGLGESVSCLVQVMLCEGKEVEGIEAGERAARMALEEAGI
jgi:hypothetical protein